ncbi:hypothetical protein [Halobacillus salinus]|nr:hypothetical protein [Halobacillus salinus]
MNKKSDRETVAKSSKWQWEWKRTAKDRLNIQDRIPRILSLPLIPSR